MRLARFRLFSRLLLLLSCGMYLQQTAPPLTGDNRPVGFEVLLSLTATALKASMGWRLFSNRAATRYRRGVPVPPRRRRWSDAGLVLSVVDTCTGEQHLVAIETAALHRRSGRYPALCGAVVAAASLTTPPSRHCQNCIQQHRGKPDLHSESGSRRARLNLRWPRWANRRRGRHR